MTGVVRGLMAEGDGVTSNGAWTSYVTWSPSHARAHTCTHARARTNTYARTHRHTHARTHGTDANARTEGTRVCLRGGRVEQRRGDEREQRE